MATSSSRLGARGSALGAARTALAPLAGRLADPRPKPIEHSIVWTATLCLLAAGAVMVYSASSAESMLGGTGDASFFLKKYLVLGAVGLLALHLCSRLSLSAVRRLTPVLLLASFVLCVALLVPGLGVTVNGATRWLGLGPLQFQPSELLKVSLVLYSAHILAARPARLRTLKGVCSPLLVVVGGAFVLLMAQPDMGTSMVIVLSIGALMVAAGVPGRHLALIGTVLVILTTILAIVEPYRRERLTSFLDPWADAGDSGFQAVQSMIAIGSGGLFGVGLGESVQKVFYLPEAHTDMILAIVGEELGIAGVAGLVALYGLIAYGGLRAAKAARDRYAALLAAGITSLVLCQAILNAFATMGMAPLTGVPLPFISFGNSNLIVLLAGMGLLLNVAAGGGTASASGREVGAHRAEPATHGRPGLRVVEGEGRDEVRGDRGGRDGRARGARARGRRGAVG